jgi:Zn-finger nucleic acid-binding protein
MHCPSCSAGMEAIVLETHIGTPVTIDACWPCHLIWFDHLESASLSAGSVVELFKRIHAERDRSRNLVRMQTDCPICNTALQNTSDIAKGGRFAYSRCGNGHGRLIAFTQFLREKNFIRSLQPYEIARLAVKVKQIRCSSCGGPINLESDKACTHCGAAISVLDSDAVEKALLALQTREAERVSPSPERIADALLAAETAARRSRQVASGTYQPHAWMQIDNTVALADLVEIGVSALVTLFEK